MDYDFQTVLNNRKFECLRVVRGVKIIDRSNNLFNNFVEDILDQLFIERLLEDGKCCVCQAKTSKCCSNCGTHYCSSACQGSDWLSHKITCLRSQLKSAEDSVSKKPAQLESASVDYVCKDSKANVKRKFDKNTDTEAENTSSSFQDLSDIGVRNTGGYESDTDTGTEKSKRVIPGHYKKNFKFKPNKTSEKAQSDKESEDSIAKEKEITRKFDWKTNRKKLVPGQKIVVKRVSWEKSNHWVIDKRDAEKFEEIHRRLGNEWETYPEASDTTSDLFAHKYNKKWRRCRAFTNGDKTLVRCVDIGNIFYPKNIVALELPDDLKTGNGLAFRVCFEDRRNLPDYRTEWLKVRVVKMLPKGVYSVKLEENNKIEPDKKNLESLDGEEKKKKEKSWSENENWMEESLTEREDPKPRRSVMDKSLKPTTRGIFLPGKIGKEELLGCFAPEDNDEAMSWYNKITGLYVADGNKIDANVGDDVMVAGEDTIGHRGIVKSKSDNKYTVQLVDYGYTVETCEVYEMPEKTADMIQLACRVTLLPDPPRRYDEFEVKRAYEFEVMEKKAKGDWLCKFAIYPKLKEAFAYGIVTWPWKRRPRKCNYVPFLNGCEVVVTGVGNSNTVNIKHCDGMWDELLEKLNLKLNQYVMDTDLNIDDVHYNDILLCQYKQDELWYRARVLHKKEDVVKVVFVDYGNIQLSTKSELRRMPEGVDDPFFSRGVKLVGPSNSFSPEGKEYLQRIKNYNKKLILSYNGEDISGGVTLFSEDGTNINEIAFGQKKPPAEDMDEEYMNMSSSCAVFDKEKFLKPEGFNVGVVENFVCLYLEKAAFKNEGVFWAVNPESNNFKYIIELDSKLSKHCESDSENISPEAGMLCIAKYQGGWYRGLISDSFGPLMEVFFVDFGNTQILERKYIRKMVPEFFEVPATAVKCILNGFDKAAAAQITRFETFISDNLNKTLKNTAVVVNVVDNAHYVEFRTKI